MSQNNPQVEKITIWGFTSEEIERRWKVSEEFHPINRLFGATKAQDNTTSSPPALPKVNENPKLMSFLEALLPEG